MILWLIDFFRGAHRAEVIAAIGFAVFILGHVVAYLIAGA